MRLNRVVFLIPGLALMATLAGISVFGADAGETQLESEYYLPEGKAEAGREAFVRYRCHACHTVKGGELPVITKIMEGPNLSLNLTGKESGKIATSILAPSHTIAYGYGEGTPEDIQQSPMPDFTGQMTVRELEDIVTYLQTT